MGVCAHMSAGVCGIQKWVLDSLEPGLQAVMSCQKFVLRTKFGSCEEVILCASCLSCLCKPRV